MATVVQYDEWDSWSCFMISVLGRVGLRVVARLEFQFNATHLPQTVPQVVVVTDIIIHCLGQRQSKAATKFSEGQFL